MSFPEYLSTTLESRQAWMFNYTVDAGALFVFRVQKEHIPWIVPEYRTKKTTGEYEVLLPRGTQWRVVRTYKTSIDPAEAAVATFLGITPEDAVKRTRENPIRVYEMESLPYTAPFPIRPLEEAPSELLVVPQDPIELITV